MNKLEPKKYGVEKLHGIQINKQIQFLIILLTHYYYKLMHHKPIY